MDAQKFEARILEIIPDVSPLAMRNFISYANELDHEGTHPAENFFHKTFVEFSLIKKHNGADFARKLFNIAKKFTLNPFEIRGAARLLKSGMAMDVISQMAVDGLCDQTMQDRLESKEASYLLEREAQKKTIMKDIKSRVTADMPECVRLLTDLEESLRGQKGQLGEWMQAAYELYECYELPPAVMTAVMCDTLKQISHKYGNRIARDMYNSLCSVSPMEMPYAAEYLHLGGKLEHIRKLSDVGFFMPYENDQIGYEEKLKVVTYVNGGGSIDEVFKFIESEEAQKMATGDEQERQEPNSPSLCQY